VFLDFPKSGNEKANQALLSSATPLACQILQNRQTLVDWGGLRIDKSHSSTRALWRGASIFARRRLTATPWSICKCLYPPLRHLQVNSSTQRRIENTPLWKATARRESCSHVLNIFEVSCSKDRTDHNVFVGTATKGLWQRKFLRKEQFGLSQVFVANLAILQLARDYQETITVDPSTAGVVGDC